MNETNPWLDLLKLERVEINHEDHKKKVLDTEGDSFPMMCFYYVDTKLESSAKMFKKTDYDKVQTFFSKIPTLEEYNIFLSTF